MIIKGKYKMKHNERCPYYVIEYIRERGEALERLLESKLDDSYTVSLDYSRHSEAIYLYIDNENGEAYTISFRNHNNFAGSYYDFAFYLSHFNNWTECKQAFLNLILPKILKNECISNLRYYNGKIVDLSQNVA